MWSYKALLVHVGLSRSFEARIHLAADLADRFGGTLIGLGTATPDMAGQLDRAEESFHAASHRAARYREWRSFIEPPALALPREARAADLLILGAEEDMDDGSASPMGLDAVMERAGRPVLLVPQGIRVLDASRIVIAWSDTRSTRRAIAAALPLLKMADKVLISADGGAAKEDTRQRSLSDLALYLLRHDVPAEEMPGGEPDALTTHRIARAAQRAGADLIVSGGCDEAAPQAGHAMGLFGECWLVSH